MPAHADYIMESDFSETEVIEGYNSEDGEVKNLPDKHPGVIEQEKANKPKVKKGDKIRDILRDKVGTVVDIDHHPRTVEPDGYVVSYTTGDEPPGWITQVSTMYVTTDLKRPKQDPLPGADGKEVKMEWEK